MARTGPSRRSRKAETYRHEEEALLRPDVGTQAQFRKKKPPKAYRYDSSLSPALDWDGGNWAREYGEWLISLIEEAAALPPPNRFDVPRSFAGADRRVEIEGLADAVHELSRIGTPFLDWAGIDYSEVTVVGDADSQDFAKDSAEASSQVGIYDSDQQAEAALTEFSGGLGSGGTEDCFQDLVEKAMKEEGTSKADVKLGEIDIGELSFTPPSDVDEAKAWQIAIPVEIRSGTFKGISADVYLDYVTLREGDTVAIVSTQDILDEFDTELRDKLVEAVAARMTMESAT